ncbi:hypothetical protein ES707_14263 [subsurface metagenome]
MKDIPITKETKEIWDIIDDVGIEIGKGSCLCLINPAQRALLKDIEDLKFGVVIKMKVQNGLPMEWSHIIKRRYFKALKKIKPSDFDN